MLLNVAELNVDILVRQPLQNIDGILTPSISQLKSLKTAIFQGKNFPPNPFLIIRLTC